MIEGLWCVLLFWEDFDRVWRVMFEIKPTWPTRFNVVPQYSLIPGCLLGACVNAAPPLLTLTAEGLRFARDQDTQAYEARFSPVALLS